MPTSKILESWRRDAGRGGSLSPPRSRIPFPNAGNLRKSEMKSRYRYVPKMYLFLELCSQTYSKPGSDFACNQERFLVYGFPLQMTKVLKTTPIFRATWVMSRVSIRRVLPHPCSCRGSQEGAALESTDYGYSALSNMAYVSGRLESYVRKIHRGATTIRGGRCSLKKWGQTRPPSH